MQKPAPMRVKRHKHNLNLVMTILTAGFWAPAWALITWDINRQNKRERERYAREELEYARWFNAQVQLRH